MDSSLISASLLTLLLSFSSFHFVDSTTFKIVNRCRDTIWPGILTGANRTVLTPTGFTLESGKSRTLTAPKSWSGRLWARTLCSNDSSGQFSCSTADCGSGKVECAGAGAIPPATLAEFTLNGDQGLDFYDVSLVDGYNLPMLVVTMGGTSGGCNSTGCVVDLNGACPAELRVARGDLGVACRSACEAFGDPQYCCTESFSTPDTCQPSAYSRLFKTACPLSHTYAYDDKNSTFTCAAADYMITFCPSPYTSGSEDEDYESDEPDWLNEGLEGPDDDDIFPSRETIKKRKRQPLSFDQGADEGWYSDPKNEDLHHVYSSSDEECEDKYPEFIEEVYMKKPQLRLGMKFATPQIFGKAMKEWNIQHGYDIKYTRNDNRAQYSYPEFDNSSSQPRIINCPKFSTFPNLDGATHLYLSPLVMAEEGVGQLEVAGLCPDLHWEVAS